MNFDIPAGFTARPDGRGGFIVRRPPIVIRYPCGKCGIDRSEQWIKEERRMVLVCYPCGEVDGKKPTIPVRGVN